MQYVAIFDVICILMARGACHGRSRNTFLEIEEIQENEWPEPV